MRISEAAQRLGISPRMLRYREDLGLLPQLRPPRRPGARAARRPAAPRHRQFTAADLDATGLGLAIEDRYGISPAALAFGVRVLADPRAAALVADFGRRIGRIQPPPARALDFEQERARRLLGLGPARDPQSPASRGPVGYAAAAGGPARPPGQPPGAPPGGGASARTGSRSGRKEPGRERGRPGPPRGGRPQSGPAGQEPK